MLLFSLLLKVVLDGEFLFSSDSAFHDRVAEGRKDLLDYGLKKVLLPTPREFCRRSLS